MADVINKSTLFPAELVPEFIQKTKGASAIAKLCAAEPIPFNGVTSFTFQLDREIDVVNESGKKGKGGATVAPVTIAPIKVEYGARISDEFLYAADDAKLDYMRAFADGFAKKVAKGFDIMAMHGINPRSGTASSVIGENNFDSKITNAITIATGDTPDDNIDDAIALVQANECEVNGVILAPAFKSSLAAQKVNGVKQYPELAWGNSPSTINGLRLETSPNLSTGDSVDRALVGDFSDAFKWGFAKEIPIEIIRYGNPDNDATLGDLKGSNQVYIRGEMFIGWGILDADAFAFVKEPAPEPDDDDDTDNV